MLAMATALTLGSLVVGRLGGGIPMASGGGYSYMLLATILPLAGILLGHVTRTRTASVGAAGVLVAVSLIGVATISDNARSLSAWKLEGQRLMQTAAASLTGGMATYPDQRPVPVTAPTVTQADLRDWADAGWLDAVVAGALEADQASLNTQWRIVPTGGLAGDCSDLSSGGQVSIPAGATVGLVGLEPGAMVDLRYPETAAVRRLIVPTAANSLESLAGRATLLGVAAGSVRLCVDAPS
jgi:hypothetical protein